MTGTQGTPLGLDVTTPNVARMYDYHLRGHFFYTSSKPLHPRGDGRHGVKIPAGAGGPGLGSLPLCGRGSRGGAGGGVAGWARAARDAGASWDANPFLSLALGS